jgi:hypothetical protein
LHALSLNALTEIVQKLDIKASPYVIFMVPVLSRMSDPDGDIRPTATDAVSSLIKMVQLHYLTVSRAGLSDPPGFPEELLSEEIWTITSSSSCFMGATRHPCENQRRTSKYQQDGED